MKAAKNTVSIAITLLLAACRSNQNVIRQAAHDLTAQLRQVTDTPPPGTSSESLLAVCAGITILTMAVVAAIVLFKHWRNAVEKAAYEEHKGDFKAREAQQKLRMQARAQSQLYPMTPNPQQLDSYGRPVHLIHPPYPNEPPWQQ